MPYLVLPVFGMTKLPLRAAVFGRERFASNAETSATRPAVLRSSPSLPSFGLEVELRRCSRLTDRVRHLVLCHAEVLRYSALLGNRVDSFFRDRKLCFKN